MPFPDDTLDVRVEAALGADLTADPSTWEWTDLGALGDGVYDEDDLIFEDDDIVTEGWGRLLAQQLQIRRGRADESSQPQPASVSLVLDNPDGWLTPGNAVSPFFGMWQRGVPLRIKAGAGETALVLQGFEAGAALPAALSLPADFFVAVETRGQFLLRAGQYQQAGNQRGWLVIGNGWRWSPDGATFTDWSPTWPAWVTDPNGRAAIGFHMIPDDGAGGHRVVAYAARRLGDPWEQIDEYVDAGTTTVFASSAPLVLGDPWGQVPSTFGSVYRAEVRSGGPDGTLLASPDFTVAATGATEVTDGQGNVWTVTGEAEVAVGAAGWVRFFGQVAEIAPEWPYGDIERGDYPGESRVRVTAAGVLRRMGQGSKPLLSALRKEIPSTDPVGYWPLEDNEGATQAASAVVGVGPAAARDVMFRRVDGPPGSDRLPDVRGFIDARIPRGFGVATEPCVTFLYHASSAPSSPKVVVEGWSVSFASRWTLEMWDGNARFRRYSSDGTLLTSSPVLLGPDVWEGWQWVQIGSDGTSFFVNWWNVGGSSGGYSDTGGFGRVSRVVLRGGSGWSFGHLVVFDDLTAIPGAFPADGWLGEPAAWRLERIAAEQGLPLRVTDAFYWSPTPVGSQLVGTELDEVLRVAAADGGVLREERDSLGLEYRTRASLYNQTPVLVLDAALSEIANPFAPVDDDQRLRNMTEVRLAAGSSAQAIDEASRERHGDYEESLSLNLAFDWQAVHFAGWRLHLGTWPGMRYPSLTVDLTVAPHLADRVSEVREGDRIQVVNLPSQHPAGTVDLLVEGITETLSPSGWTVEFTCSPAGPWTVGVVEDEVLGRADSAGCVLDAGVDADETTWGLDTTVGPEWITTASHPDEFPFDIEAAGEVVTVTAITGTGTQIATVVRSVNGVRKSHPAGTPVSLAHPAVAAL